MKENMLFSNFRLEEDIIGGHRYFTKYGHGVGTIDMVQEFLVKYVVGYPSLELLFILGLSMPILDEISSRYGFEGLCVEILGKSSVEVNAAVSFAASSFSQPCKRRIIDNLPRRIAHTCKLLQNDCVYKGNNVKCLIDANKASYSKRDSLYGGKLELAVYDSCIASKGECPNVQISLENSKWFPADQHRIAVEKYSRELYGQAGAYFEEWLSYKGVNSVAYNFWDMAEHLFDEVLPERSLDCFVLNSVLATALLASQAFGPRFHFKKIAEQLSS